jgi:hypothetical protein
MRPYVKQKYVHNDIFKGQTEGVYHIGQTIPGKRGCPNKTKKKEKNLINIFGQI